MPKPAKLHLHAVEHFRRGAIAAAAIADGYNAVTLHDHRLGDCILAKLNIRKERPRRNRKRPDMADMADMTDTYGERLDAIGEMLVSLGMITAAGVKRDGVRFALRNAIDAKPRIKLTHTAKVLRR